MRRVVLALAALALLRADMYPDAGNAKLPEARTNLGLGLSASITDYGADPTGAASSEAAFTSCIGSGKDCKIPAGTYLLGCAGHSAPSGMTLYGEGARASILKLPPSCTLPSNWLNGANIKDLTIDGNGATLASAGLSVLSPTYPSNQTPTVERTRIYNFLPVGYLITLSNATNPVIRSNYLAFTASATTPNRCLLFTTAGGPNLGGEVADNRCVNAGMWFDGDGIRISNNDISGWAYSAAIGFDAAPNNKKHIIIGNYLHDSATTLDVDSTPGLGMEIWASDVLVADNMCVNVGGSCIDIGGQRSLISGNRARGVNKHNYPGGLGAYGARYLDATYNANNSYVVGNWAGDDGSGVPMYGYAEQGTSLTGITLANNDFNTATTARVAPSLSPATIVDTMSSGGRGGGLVLVAKKTASASASLEFTGLDTSGYGSFELVCAQLQLSSGAGADLAIQAGEGPTPTWLSSHEVAMSASNSGGAALVSRNVAGTGYMVANASPLVLNSVVESRFTIEFSTPPPLYRMFMISSVYPTGSVQEAARGVGRPNTTNAITAVRVMPAAGGSGTPSGTIAAGVCSLYGRV